FEIAMERQQRQLEGETASQRYELELVRKDGTRAIIESVTRMITENDQPVGIQAMARDITELKRWRENMLFYISEITRAQEEERKRIARELHDETAQALATLLLDIEAITRARERLSEETLQQLEQLRDKIEPIMEGVRRFSHELRPGVLDQLGLLPALEWLAEDMIASYEIDARVEVIGTPRRLSAEEELVLFRIAQEALSNVRKHSQATEAVVRVEFCDDKIRMAITDNGQGFELPDMLSDFVAKGKLGILGMHERARLLDGSFSVQSEAGKGTTVSVEVAG
ncbi:MAG: PAS domain-containing sensor histidine kinase, partial [Dehalococcoidia bacterium]